MIGNLSKVQERLRVYSAVPDKQFNVRSGLNPQEEAVKQKVRQYWADKSIPDVKKLEGLNINLTGFDPRKTSNRQLRDIGALLAEQGIIDGDLIGTMGGINVEFDAQGKEINIDKEVNAYEFFTDHFLRLQGAINQGNEMAKGAVVDLNTAVSVLMALEEHAKRPRERSLVNIRA